ncbi:ADP-ribosylglycohydrolase family protein [Luteolibacter sp. GHJ8]|uniref:ADP-ribosylglycohydrolase family protein n=1 Tax=Luteolibacter rhizosphaerae TaxID=2989719 RepID=A0ABT3GB75_9BACT|nr:ADP-ribosylglycohydrolase family protein [Luteolibacter rhizosphaerae]MCW1917097.1 ADP-ribosylglycohydrolase family protein [Luteolibacter rhizosphaerae]
MTTFAAAYQGSLAADALAMPVHWYYNREWLRRDYGVVDRFVAPRNPHPEGYMQKLRWEPLNEKADIMHEEARYVGQKEIHYHQHLKGGENTLNFRLAAELYRWVIDRGDYDVDAWLEHYLILMLMPGWNKDTYIEECHRNFFASYAEGKPPRECGVADKHIGGLAAVPALLAALEVTDPSLSLESLCGIVRVHVGLTHPHEETLRAAVTLVKVLYAIKRGASVREAIRLEAADWLRAEEIEGWIAAGEEDNHVVGERFSSACYVEDSVPSSLYLAWKYHDDFKAGLVANAMAGGDNCHRGAFVGSVLAAGCGGSLLDFSVQFSGKAG